MKTNFQFCLGMALLTAWPLAGQAQTDAKVSDDQTLIQNVQSATPEVREKAGMDLWLVGPDPSRVAALLDILNNSTDRQKRNSAIRVLTVWRSPEAVLPLIKLLDSNDDSMVYAAGYGLGLLADARAVNPMIKVFNTTKLPVIKEQFLLSLGRIPDPRVTDFLKGQLTDSNQALQSAAAAALGLGGDASGHDVALSILKTKNEKTHAFMNAIVAVGECENPADMPFLTELGKDANLTPGDRNEMEIARYKIRSKTMSETDKLADLHDFLYGKSDDPSVQMARMDFAVRQMSIMNTPASIAQLKVALEDPALAFYRGRITNFMRVYAHP